MSKNHVYLFVGSKNPVKINSVKFAVVEHWPKAFIKGYDVSSGVPAQPVSDEETRQGATNRAGLALKAGLADLAQQKISLEKDSIALGIGLEGGISSIDDEMWTTVWVTVVDPTAQTFSSSGSRFLVPERIAKRIRSGEEMGLATQHITGIENVKHKSGLIGVLTEGFTNRTEEYSAIAKMSIGLWFGRDWAEHLSEM